MERTACCTPDQGNPGEHTPAEPCTEAVPVDQGPILRAIYENARHGKAQAPGRTDRMPSHLCLAHCGPGLLGYQTGARVVRQAQEQAGPEYIRPDTASSKRAVTPSASKSTYDVRWGNLDMGIEIQFARIREAGQPG